jgi:hypothetical protein
VTDLLLSCDQTSTIPRHVHGWRDRAAPPVDPAWVSWSVRSHA